jgi:hypothetical protein
MKQELPVDVGKIRLSHQESLEWEAWQEVVAQLKVINVDINDQDSLNDSLRRWAKEFAKLAEIHPQLLT